MNESGGYRIRPLTPSDQPFLWEMLYQSLYVPEGSQAFERTALNDPDIAKYVEGWGRVGDSGFVAVDANNQPVGAVWLRLFSTGERGYGYVDDKTPELGIAVLPEHHGRGIGTSLLSRLLESAGDVYECVSLSVAFENPSMRLYRRLGFEVVGERGGSVIMKRTLKAGEGRGAT